MQVTVGWVFCMVFTTVVLCKHRQAVIKNSRLVPAGRLLNARERQILALVVRGMSANEIAQLMFMSSGAVESALQRMTVKLDVQQVGDLRGWGEADRL
jgi:DNA-binding CsgD family transcriptional regulator